MWAAGIYVEYNSNKYYTGSTIIIDLNPNTLPVHSTSSMRVGNDAGWTQDSNNYYGTITTTLSGSQTPTNASFLMGSYTASYGTPVGNDHETSYYTYNSSASHWYADFQLAYYYTSNGNKDVTLTVTETDTRTGSTLLTATFTIRYRVNFTGYTITYHLTGVEAKDNKNPIAVKDGQKFDAYFNYSEGYTGPLTYAHFSDGFYNDDMGDGSGTCYYTGSYTSDFMVRYNTGAGGNIDIYLTATVDACAVPTFSTSNGDGLSFGYLFNASDKPTGLQVSGGKVTDKHSKTVTEYGWCFSKTNPPTVSSARRYYSSDVTANVTLTGYGNCTDLDPGTKYYFRAYATVNCGTGYGTVWSITTPYRITLDKNNSDAGSTTGNTYIVPNGTNFYTYSYHNSTTAPTRTGYTLEGYYTTPGCDTKIATAAGALQASRTVGGNEWTNSSSQWKRDYNETFYAKWTAHTYTVRFNKNDNDATGTMENQAFTYGVAQNLTSCGFSKEGYMFAGWALDADGEKYFDNEEEVSNLTATDGATFDLYAVWEAAPLAVHWMVNGVDWSLNPSAHGNPTIAVASGSKPTQLPTTPVAGEDGCGSTFMGWTTAPIDGSRGTAPTPCWNSLSCGTCFPAITAETWYYAVFADEQP